MTETEIQAEILTYLKYRGIPATRNQSGRVNAGGDWVNLGEAGWPDIVGCLPGGRFLGVEVKRPREKPSAKQAEMAERIAAAGGLIIVAASVEDVEKGLREA